MKLKVSLIDFLNSVPLQWGLTDGAMRDRFELLSDVPSECARHLRDGQADIGLIPVIEYQRIPSLRVLPGISVASKREVKSVLFVSKKPAHEVKSIAADTSSRTSAALLRILLAEAFDNTEARLVPEPPDPVGMLSRHDAALLIGNPALRVDRRGLIVYDLANQWFRMTGLPFVFAFWAVRGGVDLGADASCLYESRREGIANLERISEIYSRRLGLPRDEIRAYLGGNLDYSLDEANRKGLDLYFRLAAKWDLISDARPLEFHEVPQAATR